MTLLASHPKLYNIPAGISFSDALAEGILHLYGNQPEILAQTTIFLPSKRGIRALQDSFLNRRGYKLMIMPSMRSLGEGLDEEPSLLAEDEPSASYLLTQKRVLSGGIRQLALTKIILEYLRPKKKDLTYPDAFALAATMIELMDSLQSERIDFSKLKEIDVGSHAEAWQENLEMLNIITDIYPKFLDVHGLIDPAPYRNSVLETLTQSWEKNPPKRPIIAAGSTGSMPASADFMKLIGRLPQGMVVLPGFDENIIGENWEDLSADHPQYGLTKLIEHFGVAPEYIKPFYSIEKFLTPNHRAKAKFFHEVMRPSQTTEAWFDLPSRISLEEMEKTLEGLRVINAQNTHEEALSISLIIREALERDKKKAVLITPNRILARRVCVQLKKWGILPDDSAGMPLSDTPQGHFLKLLCDTLESNFSILSLLAFLKHPLVTMGEPQGYFKKKVRLLEDYLLRGTSPPEGLAGLRFHYEHIKKLTLENPHKDKEKIEKFPLLETIITQIENVFTPLTKLPPKTSMADFISAFIESSEEMTSLSKEDEEGRLCGLWGGDSGTAMQNLLMDFSNHSGLLGLLPQTSIRTHLMEFTAKISVRPTYSTNKNVFIWGTPEARLQQMDVIILGGLTEGSWPISPDTGIWLSRLMRQDIGLSAPERRIGLSAHDFVQAVTASRVFLTYSQKDGGAILTPSRWIIRLENILKGLFNEQRFLEKLYDTPYLSWARQLEEPDFYLEPIAPPNPCPPLEARPTQLSVTDIEKWVIDPYSIYARYILKLKKKRPIAQEMEASDKGNLVHIVLYRFMSEADNLYKPNAKDILFQIIEEELELYEKYPAILTLWRPRLQKMAEEFILAERKVLQTRKILALETYGKIDIPLSSERNFTLQARVDRIDVHNNTQDSAIIDYKTSGGQGKKYSPKIIKAGYSPQIPLQGFLLNQDGFDKIENKKATLGEYIFVKSSYEKRTIQDKDVSFTQIVQDNQEGLLEWLEKYEDQSTPYPSHLASEMIEFELDYDHLARIKQWKL